METGGLKTAEGMESASSLPWLGESLDIRDMLTAVFKRVLGKKDSEEAVRVASRTEAGIGTEDGRKRPWAKESWQPLLAAKVRKWSFLWGFQNARQPY